MSAATAWRLTTAVLFTIAAAIGTATVGPVAAVSVLAIWMFWLTCCTAARDELARVRRSTIVALGALRRRHDGELLDLWVASSEKPAAEYVPEGVWAPAEIEQPTVFDPVTEPVDMNPATVPDGMPLAVQSALLAEDRTWLEEQHAIALAELRKIGREAAA